MSGITIQGGVAYQFFYCLLLANWSELVIINGLTKCIRIVITTCPACLEVFLKLIPGRTDNEAEW